MLIHFKFLKHYLQIYNCLWVILKLEKMSHGYCNKGRINNVVRYNQKINQSDWENQESLRSSQFISIFSLGDTKPPIKPPPATLSFETRSMYPTEILKDSSGRNLCDNCKINRYH